MGASEGQCGLGLLAIKWPGAQRSVARGGSNRALGWPSQLAQITSSKQFCAGTRDVC